MYVSELNEHLTELVNEGKGDYEVIFLNHLELEEYDLMLLISDENKRVALVDEDFGEILIAGIDEDET